MNCALRFRTFAPTNSTETLASFCHPALISAPRVLCAPETRIRVQNARRVSRTEVSPWCVADTAAKTVAKWFTLAWLAITFLSPVKVKVHFLNTHCCD